MPDRSRRRRGPTRALVAMLMGIALLVFGCILLINQIVFTIHAEPATALVIGSSSFIESGRGGCSKLTYQPEITFTTRTGRRIVTDLPNSTSCSKPRTGVSMQIVYDRTDPTTAQQRGQSDIWVGLAILFIVGVGFLTYSRCSHALADVTAQHQRTRPDRGDPTMRDTAPNDEPHP